MRVVGFALAVLSVLGAASAEAQEGGPAVVVTPGTVHAFRAAVQGFADRSLPPDLARVQALRATIEEGLEFSNVLVPLPRAAFLGPEQTLDVDEQPTCSDWTQSGADALVEGEVAESGGSLLVTFKVWDTARCVQLLRDEIRRPAASLRRLGKLVADSVVQAFTGARGAAATDIAFISTRTGRREVFVMDADGGNPRSATRSASIKAFPDWLPRGDGIIYTSYMKNGQPSLFLTSRGGARPGPILTKVLPQMAKYRGVVAADGETMALVGSVEGNSEIFRVRRDGKKLRRLTRGAGINVGPSWSPDGKRLAFVSDRSGSPQIYMMDRDGKGVRRLTFQGSYNTSPAWSPDGRWIAYESRIDNQFDIWLIDPEGEVNFPLIAHPRTDEAPSWSPDGRMLAFSSTRRGRKDIYIVDASGQNLRRLTQQAGDNSQPSWGPFAH